MVALADYSRGNSFHCCSVGLLESGSTLQKRWFISDGGGREGGVC